MARIKTNDELLQLPSELDMARVKEVVPVEALDFYNQLTGRDKQVLRKVLAKADSYTSTSEVLKDLRNGSSTLYDRAVQVVTSLRSIIARLSPPARTYIDESAEQLRNALGDGFSMANLKAQVQQLVSRYRQLDLATKVELRETFPTVASVVDNPLLQTLASGLFDIQTDVGVEQPGAGGGGSGGRRREEEGDNGGGTGGKFDDNGNDVGSNDGQVEDEVAERAERRLAHR
ncbi:hypothetical protein GPALN_006533 [Globodera pallida]|nr:hypothetical protein GPALN_006533 [Globodera pallida]